MVTGRRRRSTRPGTCSRSGRRPDLRPNSVDGVIWFPYEVPAGEIGRSPIERCIRAVEYLAALYDMAGSFWEAGFPSMAVMVAQRLSPDDTQKLKDQFAGVGASARTGGDGQRRPSLAGRFLRGRVATHGIDRHGERRDRPRVRRDAELVNVAAGDSLTYSTTEVSSRNGRRSARRYLARIEATYTDMTPYGTTARFDTVELYRGDSLTQAPTTPRARRSTVADGERDA